MIEEAIKKVCRRLDLSELDMSGVMSEIMDGGCSAVQIACFLTALSMKGETADELTAAARVMRGKALGVPLRDRSGLVDIVGTGGDGGHSFNISTAAAFVASAAGLRVAKHGNRSVSSRSGSADVMERLGININLTPELVGRCIDETGIGFLFAPLFHVAMKHAAPVRRELGIRTIFNLLGPLTNPADAEIQRIGVYDERLAPLFSEVLKRLGRKRALIVHGGDGLDELSICAENLVYDVGPEGSGSYVLKPEDAGIPRSPWGGIRGGNAEENAGIIIGIFTGAAGPCRDAVVLNAGAAIMAGGLCDTVRQGAELAADAIDSGRALQKLRELKEFTQSFN